MLPTFLVIGEMKCGTTSLHYYLDLHPQIFMSKHKELDFFIAERNWQKGISWYQSNFGNEAGILSGESSTGYTKYPQILGVPQRMYSVLPGAKLIYVVRDPVERIISHYIHECAQGTELRTIDEALKDLENNHYVETSSYFLQLQQFLEFYPSDRILTVAAEDLRESRNLTLRKIYGFLNVDDEFHSPEFSRVLHRSIEKRRKNWLGHLFSKVTVRNYQLHVGVPASGQTFVRRITGTHIHRPILNARLRQDLIERLRGDVNSLRSFTGMEFKLWCL